MCLWIQWVIFKNVWCMYYCVPLSVLDLCLSVVIPRTAVSSWAQEYYCGLRVRQVTQPVCSQPASQVNLVWNHIPVLKRGVAISALSVWISVPSGTVPSLRATLLGIYSLAPDSVPLSTQRPLCSYIYFCCGTLPCIFGNYTWSHSSYPSWCRFIGEKCNWIDEKCSESGTQEEACRN